MAPLVLALEPDHRQAAIVKRIVREKVLADVSVVDSRDAALEAIRTTMPDVLLLSALLSPRDEDELIAHLRTLQDAEHLQTHTIPQLASAIGGPGDEPKPAKGRLAGWLRRKDNGSAPAGCDPDLFAEEIRTYLRRASDKKRELLESARHEMTAPPPPTSPVQRPRTETAPAAAADAGSSWASPFEWRPSGSPSSVLPDGGQHPGNADRQPPAHDRQPEALDAQLADLDPRIAGSDPQPALPDPQPAVLDAPLVIPDSQAANSSPEPAARARVVMRYARHWWFEDAEPQPQEPERELAAMLAALAVPEDVAAMTYAEGCRIRRVRTAAVVTA